MHSLVLLTTCALAHEKRVCMGTADGAVLARCGSAALEVLYQTTRHFAKHAFHFLNVPVSLLPSFVDFVSPLSNLLYSQGPLVAATQSECLRSRLPAPVRATC